MQVNKTLQTVISSILSILIYLFGGFDSLVLSLIIVMAIDYITGICKGIYHKNNAARKVSRLALAVNKMA